MFFDTNLLTSCHSASCLFFLFLVLERQKINILIIGRDKSQSQFISVENTKSRGDTERRARAATPPRCGQGGSAPGQGVDPLVASQPRLFAYKKPPMQKP